MFAEGTKMERRHNVASLPFLRINKLQSMKIKFICFCLLTLLFHSCTQQEKNQNPQEYKSLNQENMEEVFNFIKSCNYYFIATTEGTQPRVRPFGTINIFEGKLYIQTGHVKRFAKQVAENPKIEICAYNGMTQWVRVEAVLAEDTRIEAKKSMLDAYPSLQKMYSADDENTAVYYLTNATAWFSSFTDSTRTVSF